MFADLTYLVILTALVVVLDLEVALLIWKQHMTNVLLQEIYHELVPQAPAGPAAAVKVTLGTPVNQ